jgi:hypothetical protein
MKKKSYLCIKDTKLEKTHKKERQETPDLDNVSLNNLIS